jgi:hypothetical protein
MGFFDGLGSTLLGGGLAFLGAREDQKASTQAAQAQADLIRDANNQAIEAGQPFGVGSIGGTAEFDPDSKTALLNLSPELQDIYQGALSRSGLFGEQLLPLAADPFGAADVFYEQQQPFFQRDEDRLRTDLETRLLAQGRLGSTGGREQMGTLEESILRGQNERRTQSFTQAQQLIDSLLGRESGDIGTATGLLAIPAELADIGMGVGGDLGAIAGAGLRARADAASGIAQTASNRVSPFSAGVTSLANSGLFGNKKGT